MTAPELLTHLRGHGATIELAEDRLRVRLPDSMDAPETRGELSRHKAELVALLSPEPVATRQPGKDERGFPLDRFKYIDGLEPLPDVDRRVVEAMSDLRRRGVHPPWLAAERKSEVT
ncbi:MAG: hypothetical protein SF069_10590 [Phycisphaerae bacterium]|nr:hypothetical protein [Phycisphaerae bacterium]